MIWEPHSREDYEGGEAPDEREATVEEQIADASEDQLRKIVAAIWGEVKGSRPPGSASLFPASAWSIRLEIEEGVQ